MSDYGVQPSGFVVKPLQAILDEIEQANVLIFGEGVIQTPQSPLGQINGLMADAIMEQWEVTGDTYVSFDVDGAENYRLDTIAKLRRLSRPVGESDVDFRLRISNEGQADTRLTAQLNRLRAIDGVTWASARMNNGDVPDALGLPAHSVAYAVIGGDDEEVAEAVFQNGVAGIPFFGNVTVETTIDGFCQPVDFIRPTDVPIRVEIDVKHVADACDCAPPSVSTVVDFVIAAFAGACGYRNGDTVTADRVMVEAAAIGSLKIIDVRIARNADLIVADEIETGLFERPVIISPYVSVRYV